jgi:hypothetical protein
LFVDGLELTDVSCHVRGYLDAETTTEGSGTLNFTQLSSAAPGRGAAPTRHSGRHTDITTASQNRLPAPLPR